MTLHFRPGERTSLFWSIMGPVFASTKVRKELPYLKDEAEYGWFLLTEGQDLVGFFAYNLHDAAYLNNLFVFPAHRKKGHALQLACLCLRAIRDAGCHSVVTAAALASTPLFKKLGFVAERMKGHYSVMRLSREQLLVLLPD